MPVNTINELLEDSAQVSVLNNTGVNSGESLSSNEKIFNEQCEAHYNAKDNWFTALTSRLQRTQEIASKLWGMALRDEHPGQSTERLIYKYDRRTDQLKEVEQDYQMEAAYYAGSMERASLSQDKKATLESNVKNRRISDVEDSMVNMHGKWVELQFMTDKTKYDQEKVAAASNKLVEGIAVGRARLDRVYDTSADNFMIKRAELEKDILRQKLTEYFSAGDSSKREELKSGLGWGLNYPTSNLLNISLNGGSIEERVESAMRFNRQDSVVKAYHEKQKA